MKKTLLLIALTLGGASSSQGQVSANYYRFWQGFKRTDWSADSHWNYFDRSTSHSAPMKNFDPKIEIKFGTSYNVLGKPVDWKKTHVLFFLGARKSEVSPEDFRLRMTKHVQHAASALAPQGLLGYLMLATPDYEVAYLAFESKELANSAFNSSAGKAVGEEASELMNTLMFAPLEALQGSIQPGHFYGTSTAKVRKIPDRDR